MLPQEYLTKDQAAAALGCPASRVDRLLTAGELVRHINPLDRRKVFVSRSQVEEIKGLMVPVAEWRSGRSQRGHERIAS